MGYTSYSVENRSYRASSRGFAKVTAANLDTVFTQQRERKAHPEMLPSNMKNVRECFDSAEHPNTVPIQLYLDVTGSMGTIPALLLRDGLPKLIGNLIQRGIPDVSLMFGAVGDHECDSCPLQMAQFESGDEELDMWLTRTWIEKGGGGNGGESYALAWFASQFTKTDAWEKRGQKGFVFTIGDEPVLKNYPGSALKSIFGSMLPEAKSKYTAEELYEECSKTNHVYHIHIAHNHYTPNFDFMGENLIIIEDYNTIPDVIAKTILSHTNQQETFSSKPIIKEEEFKITL